MSDQPKPMIEYLEFIPYPKRMLQWDELYDYRYSIVGIIDLYADCSAWGIGSHHLQSYIDDNQINTILDKYIRIIVRLIKTDEGHCERMVLAFDITSGYKLVGIAEQDGYGLKVTPLEDVTL